MVWRAGLSLILSAMSSATTTSRGIIRRLLPLYIAAFLQSCVFWYSIEKLFMTSIGFTAATIGLMAAIYSGAMLLVETPSGLLADRWSRKGILIIASLSLAACSLMLGLSNNIPLYLAGTVLWGCFYALYSGTYDPIVYDTLLEESGDTAGFKHYYGWVKILDGLGLIVGALAGSLIAAGFGLNAPFLWSVPVALASAVLLIVFREPKLHKAETITPIVTHVKDTFAAVLHRGSLMEMLLILVVGTVLAEMIFEFSQLWLIATTTPVAQYGLASALLMSTVALAGLLAPRLRLENRFFVVAFTSIMMLAGLTLVLVPHTWPLVAAQFIITIGLTATGIVYLERLHDRLPSGVRSGAASAISTLGRVIFIGIALGFGWLSQVYSVFSAAWLILIPLTFICVFLYKAVPPAPSSAN